MGILTIKRGDIWTTQARAIGHGVNVDGVMGAGIAKQFRDRFPAMYEEYREMCHNDQLLPGQVFPFQVRATPPQFIYNIASQDRPGPTAQLEWLQQGVAQALEHAAANGIDTIALPMIGAGIGGLDAQDVIQVLKGRVAYSVVDIELWIYEKP